VNSQKQAKIQVLHLKLHSLHQPTAQVLSHLHGNPHIPEWKLEKLQHFGLQMILYHCQRLALIYLIAAWHEIHLNSGLQLWDIESPALLLQLDLFFYR
jgi:hypothetical protein